jgi:hypothetical protein
MVRKNNEDSEERKRRNDELIKTLKEKNQTLETATDVTLDEINDKD